MWLRSHGTVSYVYLSSTLCPRFSKHIHQLPWDHYLLYPCYFLVGSKDRGAAHGAFYARTARDITDNDSSTSGALPRPLRFVTCRTGMVAGLVASAACCAIVPTWAGIIAGVVAATFAQTLATIAPMVGIDDPVNAGVVTRTSHNQL